MTMEYYDDAMIITTTMIMMAIMNMILQGITKTNKSSTVEANSNRSGQAPLRPPVSNVGVMSLARSVSAPRPSPILETGGEGGAGTMKKNGALMIHSLVERNRFASCRI